MRSSWRGAFTGVAAALALGACQLVSGLDDLESRFDESAQSSASNANASTGAVTSAGSGGAGGSGVGGGGGAGGLDIGCDAPSSKCPEVLVDDAGGRVDMLAISGNYLYLFWGSRGSEVNPPTGKISRAMLSNGVVIPGSMKDLRAGIRPDDLTANAVRVVWTSHDTANTYFDSAGISGDPGAPLSIDDGSTYAPIALDPIDQLLFWSLAGTNIIFQAPTSSLSSSSAFATDLAPIRSEILVEPGALFYHSQAGVSCNAFANGNCMNFPLSTDSKENFGLASDSANIYWTKKTAAGQIVQVQRVMGAIPATLASNEPYPSYIISDGKAVYWVNQGAADCSTNAQIRMRFLGDTDKTVYTLADKQECPSNFVDGGNFIYWGSGNKIYRQAK